MSECDVAAASSLTPLQTDITLGWVAGIAAAPHHHGREATKNKSPRAIIFLILNDGPSECVRQTAVGAARG